MSGAIIFCGQTGIVHVNISNKKQHKFGSSMILHTHFQAQKCVHIFHPEIEWKSNSFTNWNMPALNGFKINALILYKKQTVKEIWKTLVYKYLIISWANMLNESMFISTKSTYD